MQKTAAMTDEPTKKHILIAEDDDEIAGLLIHVLKIDYDVSWARDGHEALAMAGQRQPDLLLFDIMMPGLDGFQVSRFVRKIEGLQAVPIIFLTAKDEPQDIIKGIQHGARHYVAKPFKLSDVKSKVDKILKR